MWQQIGPQVRRGLACGAGDTLSEQEMLSALLHGELELWAVHEGDKVLGGLVLQIERRERGLALVVLMIAAAEGRGLRLYVPRLLALLRDYAELLGAYTIESVSRPGAARLLSRFGCKPKAVLMELR